MSFQTTSGRLLSEAEVKNRVRFGTAKLINFLKKKLF